MGRSGKERKISSLSSVGRARRLAWEELVSLWLGSEGVGEGEGGRDEENAIGVVEVEQLGWYAYRGEDVTDVRLR